MCNYITILYTYLKYITIAHEDNIVKVLLNSKTIIIIIIII